MKEILNHLIAHQTLDTDEARQVLVDMAKGTYNISQMAAFVTVYMMRSITVEELKGFRQAMLELCRPVDLSDFDTIDLCGTGGDGKDTFNISTLASFIVAGAGQKVAKHGNNGVSSVCGSSNLLQHLGYKFSNDEDVLKRELDQAGITFMHAPLFHPAMKNVAPVRKELGMKTFFNMLGPLVNPAQTPKQLVGVFSLELARNYNYLFQESNKDYTIVHALDGYDEVSLTGDFKTFSRAEERILSPQDLGVSPVAAASISGGERIEDSARIFTDILSGKGSREQNDVVLANAALALRVGRDISVADALDQARESLLGGKALQVLNNLLKN